jgi:alpha-galactosidase
MENSGLFQLRRGGVAVVVSMGEDGSSLPQLLYWDLDFGPLNAAELEGLRCCRNAVKTENLNESVQNLSLFPAFERGWMGRPGLIGSRAGRDWSPAFRSLAFELLDSDETASAKLSVQAADEQSDLALLVELELMPSGVLRARATVSNLGNTEYRLDACRVVFPIPARATELLDLSGRWAKERVPQRQLFNMGIHCRETRSGKPDLDSPLLLIAGEEAFSFRKGRVWGAHVGFSGNQELYAEALPNGGRVLGGGELLAPSEITLSAAQSYSSPWVYAAVGEGLDDMAGRFHQLLRSTKGSYRPRPVLINTWEAVYFDHSLEKLKALADEAAAIGVERFVLDDGWFGSRRDDSHGLGDWVVSPEVWPSGLEPLISHVKSLGMDFGLWIEPEMANLASVLAAEHPDWLLRTGSRLSYPVRHQYGVDLTHPEAYEHILGRLDGLLCDYDIAFLKWDHNRPLVEAGHSPAGEPVTHRQVLALYSLMAELKHRHPGLEIESCAAGGGRIDLGILEFADRVWGSDCNDPLERIEINRYTQLLLPPELIGSHIGPAPSHTTGRTHTIAFRAGVALWCNLGVELDLTVATCEQKAEVATWIAFHKRYRSLLHTGKVVNCDSVDSAFVLHGVVAADASEAIFALSSLTRALSWPPAPLRFVGLDQARRYRVELYAGAGTVPEREGLPSWVGKGLELSGAVLMNVGTQSPAPFPESTCFITLSAVS